MEDWEQIQHTLTGSYQIEKDLGTDALGHVLRGETASGECVNIHIPSREIARFITHPDDFVEVLQRASSISHPAILRIMGAGILPNNSVYYAEICPQGAVPGSRVGTHQLRSAREVARVGITAAEALWALHSKGLTHSAVSLGSLYLSETGVELGQAGLFSAMRAGGLETQAALGVLGLDGYASPEQATHGVTNSATDIYSLGACLYELLTGRHPFGGRTTVSLMAKVLTEDSSNPTSSTEIVEAILRAIEEQPEDRWENARQLELALRHGVGEAGGRELGSKTGCLACAGAIATAMIPGLAVLHQLPKALGKSRENER